jgi:hypothetical protein
MFLLLLRANRRDDTCCALPLSSGGEGWGEAHRVREAPMCKQAIFTVACPLNCPERK